MKLLFLALALVIGLAATVTVVINKKETAPVRFSVKDFPEHGVFLIGPSNPLFADLEAKLTKSKSSSAGKRYAVFLKNTGSRAVVGYCMKWECVDGSGEVSVRDTSNVVAWIFLHGEESDHRKALNRAQEIIRPNSIWFIPFDSPAQPVEGSYDQTALDTTGRRAKTEGTWTRSRP